jgi:uncharacterized protein YfbU (UPF0304 family)
MPNKFKTLSIEKLRSFKGFEKTPEKEAQQIINTLKELSHILYETYRACQRNGRSMQTKFN